MPFQPAFPLTQLFALFPCFIYRSQSDNRTDLEIERQMPPEMKRDAGEISFSRSPSMSALGLEEDALSDNAMSLKQSRSFDDGIVNTTSHSVGEVDWDAESIESDDDSSDPDHGIRDSPDANPHVTPQRRKRNVIGSIGTYVDYTGSTRNCRKTIKSLSTRDPPCWSLSWTCEFR